MELIIKDLRDLVIPYSEVGKKTASLFLKHNWPQKNHDTPQI